MCSTFWKHVQSLQYHKANPSLFSSRRKKSSRYRRATCRRRLQPRKWGELHLDQRQYYPVLSTARARTELLISLSRSARGLRSSFVTSLLPRSKFSDRVIEILWVREGKETMPNSTDQPPMWEREITSVATAEAADDEFCVSKLISQFVPSAVQTTIHTISSQWPSQIPSPREP